MTPRSSAPAIVRLALLAACATSGGCSNVDIQGSDQNTLIPVGRLTVQVTPEDRPTLLDVGDRRALAEHYALWPEREGFTGSFAIDFEVAGTHGEFTQDLAPGETVAFRELTSLGADVSAEYDLIASSVAGRGGFLLKEIVGIEGIAGVGFQHFDFDVRAGGDRAHDTTFTAGPLLGARLSLRLFHWLELYGQATGVFGIFDGPTTLGSLEPGVEIAPLPGVSVIAGYRWWEYDEVRTEPSDIEVRSAGPHVGLRITF